MSLETPPPSAFHSSPCPLVLDPQREMMATSPERHDLSVGIFGGRASDAPRSPQRPPRSPQRQTDNSEVEFLRREVLDLERVVKTLHASRTSEGRERAQQEREFAAAMVELEALRAEHADARTLALELRGDYMFPTRGWVRQGAQTSVASRCDRLFHSSPGLSDLSSACASDLDREFGTVPRIHVSTYPRTSKPATSSRARALFWQFASSSLFAQKLSSKYSIAIQDRVRSCRARRLLETKPADMASLVIFAAIAKPAAPNVNTVPNFAPSKQDNMNGEYVFSATPGGKPGFFPKHYRDYPGGVEAYDVYSPPMTTLYSQVWWKPLAPTVMPDEMVAKYNGTAMAIVGWEIDQVRRTPSGDESVPISASYNHHYTSRLVGAGARFKAARLTGPEDPRAAGLIKSSGHGMIAWEQTQYLIEEQRAGATDTSAAFSSANGGEFRKTYHGFPPGYALVVDSPTAFQVTPMQIDTWNREAMDISGPLPPPFVPGPQPAASLAPKSGALHSGLLECPMTTRLTKEVETQCVDCT